MTDISFYKVTAQPVERVLPKLLEKVRASGSRAVVLAESDQQVDDLSQGLWTYAQQSFLTHGTKKDGRAEHQPIWLTSVPENPNNAPILVIVDGGKDIDVGSFKRCLYLYNGTQDSAQAQAQQLKQTYEGQGHTLTLWHQDATGQWMKQ